MVRPPLKTLLSLPNHEYTDWYVVFLDAKLNHWWTPWLRKGFSHCYVIRWTPMGWLYFNHGIGCSEVDMLLNPTFDPRKIEPDAHRIVRVRAWREPKMRVPHLFQPFTCVESVKAILGIKGAFITTPYQLYRKLKSTPLMTVTEV